MDDEVFQQTNSASDISKISVSLRKLEAKVAEIYIFYNETKPMQIIGDKKFAELTESVEQMSSKFNDLERYRKEKEEMINNLND